MKPAWCAWMMWSLLARCCMRSLITGGNCSRCFKWPNLSCTPRRAVPQGGVVPWTYYIAKQSDYRPTEADGCTGVIPTERQKQDELHWSLYLWPKVPSCICDTTKLLTQLTEEKLTFQWYPEAEATTWSLKRSCVGPILGFPWNFKVCCHNYWRDRSMYRLTPKGPCPKLEFFNSVQCRSVE